MIPIDFNKLKSLSLDELYSLVPEGFAFKTEPWDHQLASFLATISTDGLNEWLDLGTGKSKVAIDVVRYFEWLQKRPWKVLVVCLATATEKWGEEIHAHSDCRCDVLTGKVIERWDHLQQCSKKAGFYVANYESVRLMMTHRVLNTKGKRYETIDPKKMRRMNKQGWDAIIIDEAHKIKNIDNVTFRVLNQISVRIEQRMLLTGTPFGKSLLDLWSQCFIVDRGETFGKQFGIWRQANFVDKGWFGPDWRVTKKGERRIKSLMFNRAIRYEESEIKGMPEKVYRVLNYNLSPVQNKAYNDAVGKLGPFQDIVNRTLIFRQICGGIIIRDKFKFKTNPKLVLLMDLLESVVDEYKVVIFHEFVMEYELISTALKKLDIKHSALNSTIPKSKKWPGVKAFQDDPAVRVMIAHPQSGGSSLDFNCAHYCIFYSNSHNPMDRRQCEKRIHRGKIKNRRFYYDLIAKSTIEVPMRRSLVKDESMFRGVMNQKQLLQTLRGR